MDFQREKLQHTILFFLFLILVIVEIVLPWTVLLALITLATSISFITVWRISDNLKISIKYKPYWKHAGRRYGYQNINLLKGLLRAIILSWTSNTLRTSYYNLRTRNPFKQKGGEQVILREQVPKMLDHLHYASQKTSIWISLRPPQCFFKYKKDSTSVITF